MWVWLNSQIIFMTGHYHCPKVFNENSHIVVICPSGNVYSYEVYK